MGIPPVIIRYKKDRIFHHPSSYWATPTMEFHPTDPRYPKALPAKISCRSDAQSPGPAWSAWITSMGLLQLDGLWTIHDNPTEIWMTGNHYFRILGHLHIETQKIAEDPCGSGRDALPKHWPKCLSWSERQCRIVGQRREASNGWWAAKDSLRTLRKAKSWTCWGVASQTHPESPKRTQNLLLVSSPIFTCRDDWAQI